MNSKDLKNAMASVTILSIDAIYNKKYMVIAHSGRIKGGA